MTGRRHPLGINCRVRHIDGRTGLIRAVGTDDHDNPTCLVDWDDGKSEWIVPGFLEFMPSAFAGDA
jgi:hypothetical protein